MQFPEEKGTVYTNTLMQEGNKHYLGLKDLYTLKSSS